MPRHEVQQLGQNHPKPPLPQWVRHTCAPDTIDRTPNTPTDTVLFPCNMFCPLIISSFALRRLHTNYGMGRKTNTITGASHFGAKPFIKYVAVCVRVCWYCHQSGGTDVVDLPDILLPAGQYLDLFDSESETDVPSDSSDEELVEV